MTWRPLSSTSVEREPRRVADSLERIAASIGAARPSLLSVVFGRWEELVGPDVAAHATPRSLREGVLVVMVDHPAWATSLRLLSGELLRRVAARSGDEVTELVVQVDPGPGRPRRADNGERHGERHGERYGDRRIPARPRRGDRDPPGRPGR